MSEPETMEPVSDESIAWGIEVLPGAGDHVTIPTTELLALLTELQQRRAAPSSRLMSMDWRTDDRLNGEAHRRIDALEQECTRLRAALADAEARSKLVADAVRLHELGIQCADDTTDEENAEIGELLGTGLTWETAEQIAAIRAKAT